MWSAGPLQTTQTLTGIPSYSQKITSSRKTQTAPGGDVRLGLSYFYEGKHLPPSISVLGYRGASYIHVTPSMLETSASVQAGSGRLGIASQSRNFTFSGPYCHLIILLD